MNIYGVYDKYSEGPEYLGYFTSKDDADKYAALLGDLYRVDELEVDDPDQIKRARLGLSLWVCWARSDSAGPEYLLTVSKSFDHEGSAQWVNNSVRHTQWQRNPLMRHWDRGYDSPDYLIPDCDVLPFAILATSHDDATAKAAQIRARWLAGEPIEQLRELVKAL